MQLVEAAFQSTNRYIEALANSRRRTHQVNEIELQEYVPPDDQQNARFTYSGETDQKLRYLEGIAKFQPQEQAQEIEITIEEYDTATGKMRFSSACQITANSGRIVIDLRWLVEQVRNWLGAHGANLPSQFPIQFQGDHFVGFDDDLNNLNQEQNSAVRTALGSKLSYVWGPPGTGKTTRVLATAVRQCVNRRKTVFVLAPSNNAVDNALEAILGSGVAESNVLRRGLPTQKFLNDHPTCCESKITQKEIQLQRDKILRIECQIRLLRANEVQAILEIRSETRDILAAQRDFLTGQAGNSDSQVWKEMSDFSKQSRLMPLAPNKS
ncbi:MAG: AAA domain-containing protein [Verrucomicrobiales bacterium]